MEPFNKKRSFIIPVIDFSPHSPYNIFTLLEDLKDIEGEVICIFNDKSVFESLINHKRIDKFCYNSLNPGVSRSWNIGINLSEGKSIFILNSDLHIKPQAIEQLENYLFTLDNAVIVGPQGTHIDFRNLNIIRYFEKGTFDNPVQTHDVSGFFFVIHAKRFLEHNLMFDIQFSPCFFEEWDMGLQVLRAGLASYAVPVHEFEHYWGISKGNSNTYVNYFGKTVLRDEILLQNREKFIKKWSNLLSKL